MNKKILTILLSLLLPFTAFAVTSTLDVSIVVSPTSTDGGGDDPNPTLSILNVDETPSSTTSIVTWETDSAASCYIQWGLSIGTWIDTLTNTSFITNHSQTLTGLSPETNYYYRISCYNAEGATANTSGSFTTTQEEDTTPPANINGFNVSCNTYDCDLYWGEITDPDTDRLMIYRSTSFYPQSRGDGFLVYDGDGSSLYYKNTGLSPNTRYYYTAFSVDAADNVSSGAVDDDITNPIDEPEDPVIDDPAPPYIPAPAPPPGGEGQEKEKYPEDISEEDKEILDEIDFEDFDIFGGEDEDGGVFGDEPVKAGDKISINIDSDSIPDIVKAILVKFEKEGNEFTFLLKRGPDGSLRTDIMLPAAHTGKYDVTIFLIDHNNNVVKEIDGSLEVVGKELSINLIENFWAQYFKVIFNNYLSWLLLLVLAAIAGINKLFGKKAAEVAATGLGKSVNEFVRSMLWGGLTACNVAALKIRREEGSIVLRWTNTKEVMDEHLKIYRTTSLIDAQDPRVEDLVYESKIEQYDGKFIDIDKTLDENRNYYYSIFVTDSRGGKSSGVVGWTQDIDPYLITPSLDKENRAFDNFIFFQHNKNLITNKGVVARANKAIEVLLSKRFVSSNDSIILLGVELQGVKWNVFVSREVEDVFQGSIALPFKMHGTMHIVARFMDRNNNVLSIVEDDIAVNELIE